MDRRWAVIPRQWHGLPRVYNKSHRGERQQIHSCSRHLHNVRRQNETPPSRDAVWVILLARGLQWILEGGTNFKAGDGSSLN